MKNQFLRLALVLILVSIACTLPAYADPTPMNTPKAVSQLMVVAEDGSTATPTPFQPVGPTITSTPTETPTATPVPTKDTAEKIPTPIRISQDMPEGTLNMLVLGSDARPGGGFRTDIILLVSINARAGKVSVVSFPRDLYVTIPGWTTQRINTAFGHGGFRTLADTLEYNFGVRPSYYVMTNFQGFIGIIDGLGGVRVNVGSYLSDSCDLPQASNGRCTVYPGKTVMDGATALWYVRSRHSSSDFERGRRAQEVLYGLFAQLMKLDVFGHLPELYQAYQNSVETNLSVDAIAPLLPAAANALSDPSQIHRYTIGPGQVYDYVTSEGAMVLLPNFDAIRGILNEAVYGQ